MSVTNASVPPLENDLDPCKVTDLRLPKSSMARSSSVDNSDNSSDDYKPLSSETSPEKKDDLVADAGSCESVEVESTASRIKQEPPDPFPSGSTEVMLPVQKEASPNRSRLASKLNKKESKSRIELKLNRKKAKSKSLVEPNLNREESDLPKERSFVCSICNKGFFHHSALQRHARSHTDDRPYKCEVCGNVYRQHASLLRHHSVHTGERPFKCETCGKSFRTKEVFKVHERIHQGEKPFVCRFCGRPFTQKTHLDTHERTHTGEMPFQCELCGRRFKQRESVRNHMESVHKNNSSKAYKCRFCELSFDTESELVTHRLEHSGPKEFKCDECEKEFYTEYALKEHTAKGHDFPQFICEICGKTYATRGSIRVHKRTHFQASKDQLFKCPLCPKAFRIKCTMQKHQLTHTGERPFPCDLCGTRLTSFGNLQRHYQTIHKENRTKDWVCKTCGERFLSQWLMKVHNKTHAVGDSQVVAPHVGNGSTAPPSGGNEHYPRGDSQVMAPPLPNSSIEPPSGESEHYPRGDSQVVAPPIQNSSIEPPSGESEHYSEQHSPVASGACISDGTSEGALYIPPGLHSFLPPFNPL